MTLISQFCGFFLLSLLTSQISCDRTFSIDYDNNQFLKDGKRFQYVSGSFHYSRIHPDQWEDRIIKMRAAGLNALQTYIPWNWHEFTPGQFTWEGRSDLVHFLQLAGKHDLVVMLRLGPYMCGEWEFGGLPAWLLNEDPTMVVRTSDPTYMKFVKRWFNALLAKVKPELYINGGSVGMVQIENEYGSYFACDRNYTAALRDQVRELLGEKVVMYTTDGNADHYLHCGVIPGVYPTVDFGITGNPKGALAPQREYAPKGPFVNSEFYTGWLDHWGSRHATANKDALAKSLDGLLAYNASVNMYMYIGCTNYDYFNGANAPSYQPCPTSYDYDSPISEAGDLTPKFYAVRDVVKKYLPLPSDPLPSNPPKGAYGNVTMKFISTIQDALHILCPQGPVTMKYPVNMEAIKAYYGYILYRFTLDKDYPDPTPLETGGVRDRAVVMVDSVPVGILKSDQYAKSVQITTVKISGKKGQNVDILVENQGRIGYGTWMNNNTKGIVENVTLAGNVVTGWSLYPINLDNINKTAEMLESRKTSSPFSSADDKMTTPSIYGGELNIPDEPKDTFVNPLPFMKGQLIVNSNNLGRYWPMCGPQETNYVPKPTLVKSTNKVFLFEILNGPKTSADVSFTDTPILDGHMPSGHCV